MTSTSCDIINDALLNDKIVFIIKENTGGLSVFIKHWPE